MNMYLAKLIPIALSLLTLSLVGGSLGCSSDDPVCGAGESTTVNGAEYCYYRSAITEEGFRCPEARSFRHDFDTFSVCSEEMELPEGIEARIRELLGERMDGGVDGGMPDVMSEDGGSDAADGGAFMCPASVEGLEGTSCTAEGQFCGGAACEGACSFCNIVRCNMGTWTRMEVFPAPCFSCGDSECQENVEFCHEQEAGVAGGASSFECRRAPEACEMTATCACVSESLTSVTACEEPTAGQVTVTESGA